MKPHALIFVAVVVAAAIFSAPRASAELQLEKGERIALIGNALADRMQHDGWLEAYLQAANPDKQLVIRNMGFSGDEIAHRPREENWPSADEYLTLAKTTMIFAFFGYNESFDRDPAKFKAQLTAWIDETRTRQYDGSKAPRIVLFSPIAAEDLGNAYFPDGKETNLWLGIYSDAMARVAAEKDVPFVDLFTASKALYDQSEAPLTINTVHLNDTGNQLIARAICDALGQKIDDTNVGLVRGAVQAKNWTWFNRYRATDGNDVFGNRSVLAFTDGQTNAEVLQHELKMLDVMTENRDAVVWAALKGENIHPDDSNVPPPVPVKTNLTKDGKTGSLEYVPASEGVNTLTLQKGLKANLFASEEQFPELVNPVQMDVDPQGRIWVAAWQTYPKWQPDQPMNDRLLILPDHDDDGVADRAITFAHVHNPTGFTFWNGGVVVVSAPNIWFLKDTNNDDVADFKELLFTGLDSADTHHSPNNLDYGPDGYLYYQRGVFNVSNVETPWGKAHFSGRTGMYRVNPRTHRFAFHADNSPNPHGNDFDYWGYHFATDATSGNAFQVRMDGNGKFKMHELLKKTVRPVPSSGIISSEHFPPEMNGNFIILNSIGFLGIKQYKLEYKDGNAWGTEVDDLLVSSDPNFRPTDFKFGNDGAMYVSDWCNAIVGHMQHNIRDPSRDHAHGRVYRITAEGRPLGEPVAIAGQPVAALLDVLKHPTNSVRLRARTELSARDPQEVLGAVDQWIFQFDAAKPDEAHHLLEALWLYQQFNVLNDGLLTVLLNSPVDDARRAAQRVKYMWEIEGKLGDKKIYEMHAAHGHEEEDAGEDYLKQEKSPAPALEGDTMVVHIHTLKEQMKYDRRAFAVAPGMKVKLIFKNPDAMDHNLVIVQPGTAAQVAMAAMMLGADGIKKQWLPESDKIIVASSILPRDGEQVLEFNAPSEPGAYDYVCTYPGHYMLMNGVMHVVEDPVKWMAEHKEEDGAGARKFVQEWKVVDLAGDLGKLGTGRSLAKGAEVFQAASCAICHLPGPSGGRVGPDLAGAAERLTPDAMLVELLDPSRVINPQFQSWQVTYTSPDGLGDETVFGIIVGEEADSIHILTNPLQDLTGTKIPRADIKEIAPAPLSTMPNGQLNSFTKDEILDLIAYLRSNALAEEDGGKDKKKGDKKKTGHKH